MSNDTLQDKQLSRRTLVQVALLGAALPVGFITQADAATALVPLDPADPAAKALGYTADASKVDPKANATYKPGQHCASCIQFQGKPTDARAACNIFPGKTVSSNAWCKVWAQKPATAAAPAVK